MTRRQSSNFCKKKKTKTNKKDDSLINITDIEGQVNKET